MKFRKANSCARLTLVLNTIQAKISIVPKWNVLLILLFSFSFSLAPDKSWAGFPDIGLGARPMGMGGAFVAVADDVNSIFWNPAGISQIQRVELSSMYFNPYGLSVNSQLLSGAFRHPFDGGIGLAILRTGEIDFYEEKTLILSLGQDISAFTNTEISIGINLKSFQQSMPNYDLKDEFFEKGNSWNHRAYDAGFLWHVHSLIDIGGMAANIVDDKNIAPLYRVGCTVFPREIVSIAFEGTQRHRSGSFVQQSLRIGSEYKPIVTRTGYLYKAAIRSGGRLTLSQGNQAYIGGGLEFALSDQIMARLDYALSLPLGGMNAELANTHRVSFSCVLKSTSNYQKKILSLKRKLYQNSNQRNLREAVSSLYEKWLAEGIRDSIQATRIKKQKDAWQKLNDGIKLYKSEKYQSAITELERGMKLDAGLAELYKFRALVYWKSGKLDLAKSDLDKAISIAPSIDIISSYGRFLIELIVSNEKSEFQQQYKDLFTRAARSSARGEFEVAIANWKTSLLCSSTNESIIRRQVAEAYEKWLDPENSLIDALDPESLIQIRNQQVAWEHLTAGLSNFKEARYNQARTNFEKCLELDPDLTEALKWLGSCYAMIQNEEKAKAEYRLFLMNGDVEKLPFFKFYVSSIYEMDLSKRQISPNLHRDFKDSGVQLANVKLLKVKTGEGVWMIVDPKSQRAYTCLRLPTQIAVYSGFIPTIDSLPTEAREIFSQVIISIDNIVK